jgi:hypothetical protein
VIDTRIFSFNEKFFDRVVPVGAVVLVVVIVVVVVLRGIVVVLATLKN